MSTSACGILAPTLRAASVLALANCVSSAAPSSAPTGTSEPAPSIVDAEGQTARPPEKRPCRVGPPLQAAARAIAVKELSQSPERFVDQRVRVVGYAIPGYDVSAVFERAGKHMVHVHWGDRNIANCVKREVVVVEGMFRAFPHSRWRYGLEAESMRDVDQEPSAVDGGADAMASQFVTPNGEGGVLNGGGQP